VRNPATLGERSATRKLRWPAIQEGPIRIHKLASVLRSGEVARGRRDGTHIRGLGVFRQLDRALPNFRMARHGLYSAASSRYPSGGGIGAIIGPCIERNRRAWGSLTNSVDDDFE